MPVIINKALLRMGAVVIVIILVTFQGTKFLYSPTEQTARAPTRQRRLPAPAPPPGPCTCPTGSVLLQEHLPKDQYEELVKRRAKELHQHKARTASVLSRLLFALPNSPLQYPIQGFKVMPLTRTLIPGLALYPGQRNLYKVSLNVSKGLLTTEFPGDRVKVEGHGESRLVMESYSLVMLNNLLTKVSYTSTDYHVHTGDLAVFQFEDHEAVFPITIKQPSLPVLYDMGTDISSQVTITTKTFLRYTELNKLLSSIRSFYSNIKVIIADDSFEPENITGKNIEQYIMPPGQVHDINRRDIQLREVRLDIYILGWFAGRNLAVSQVTTKYLLWVDDDFVFTEETKIEKLVEVMEAFPELDVLGGTVQQNQFYFSLIYEEGEEMDGGCLHRKSQGKFNPLPGYPGCFLASGVVNFFLARTQSVQSVGFDPKLQRVAHSEFFMDGLGSLLVATCNHVSVGHQPKTGNGKDHARYTKFRQPGNQDSEFKLQLHFFKNYLKCVKYG